MKRLKAANYYELAANKKLKWLGDPKQKTPGAKKRTTWKCVHGHKFEMEYSNLKREGIGCPYCSGNARKTDNDYKLLAKSKGITWIGKRPSSVKNKTRWKCQYGHKWDTSYTSINTSCRSGCPGCKGKHLSESKRFDDQEYHDVANANGIKWTGKSVNNSRTKTEWMCKKGHKWMAVLHHVKNGSGCPKCPSSTGEKIIGEYLINNKIKYETQKRFNNCRYKRSLPFDFYLPRHSLLIEYHGAQHYKSVKFWGGRKALKERQKRDKIKSDWAAANGITLLVIPYTEFDRIEEILSAYI